MNWDSFDQHGGRSTTINNPKDVQEALYEANEISSSKYLSNKKFIRNS